MTWSPFYENIKQPSLYVTNMSSSGLVITSANDGDNDIVHQGLAQ